MTNMQINSDGNMSDKIFNFLSKNIQNINGLTVDDIINMSDEELENNHTYIQWVFPLTEPSIMVPDAPYLSTADATLLSVNNTAIINIQKMLNRMKDFYANTKFMTPFNHNYKRITRILKCLMLMGMKTDAEVFYNFIIRLADTKFKKLCIKNADEQFWQKVLKLI